MRLKKRSAEKKRRPRLRFKPSQALRIGLREKVWTTTSASEEVHWVLRLPLLPPLPLPHKLDQLRVVPLPVTMHRIKEIKERTQATQMKMTTAVKLTLSTTPNSSSKRLRLTLSWSTTRNETKKTSITITISFPWPKSTI